MTNLQKIRIKKGITQGQLAIRSKVKKRLIEAWKQRERDINKASAYKLYAIAKVLECTIEDLLEL